MDRSIWMYHIARNTSMYTKGVQCFLKVAEVDRVNKGSRSICCPCVICKNFKRFDDISDIEFHLLKQGFMARYTCWYMHGERLIDRSTSSFNLPSDNIENTNSYIDDENDHSVDPNDNFEEMFHDLGTNIVDDEHIKLQNLFDDAEKPLYTDCEKFSKLSAVLKFYRMP